MQDEANFGKTGHYAIKAEIDTHRSDARKLREYIEHDLERIAGEHLLKTIKPGIAYTILVEKEEWRTNPNDYWPPEEKLRIQMHILCYLNQWEDAEVGDICHISIPHGNQRFIGNDNEQQIWASAITPGKEFEPVQYIINQRGATLYQRLS